jgi:hypothetical protein
MPRNRKPLKCAHCGNDFPRTAGAGLFCGDDCKAEFAKAHELTKGMLMEAGFTQHPETPNLWVKDGVAVALENVKHVGMDKTIQRHASAVAESKTTKPSV